MPSSRWRLLALAALVLACAAAGAVVAGRSVSVCTQTLSLPPGPMSCRSDTRLAPLGALAGGLPALLAVSWWRRRR